MRIPRAQTVTALLTGVMMALGTGGQAGAAQQPQPSPGQMGGGGMMTPDQMGRGGMMGPGMMGGGMMGGGMMGMAPQDRPWLTIMLDHRQQLALSAEQVGKLFDLREGFQQAAQDKARELAKAEEELATMLGPQPVDLKAAEAKLRAIEALRTELRLARLKTIEEGKRLLTQDQQAKLAQIAEQLPSSAGMGPGRSQ
jgi:Spy/CpxP family protein refolding chaperone